MRQCPSGPRHSRIRCNDLGDMLVPDADLPERVAGYRWYHRIQVTEDLHTVPLPEDDFQPLWDWIIAELANLEIRGKSVLDVGCRDGLFSFEAERRGASRVVAFDNDLSRGAIELLIPTLGSRVEMHQLNLYDLTPETFGLFDVIFCFGVLYHLRYPFWGLKKLVDCLDADGMLVIESGMLLDPRLRNEEILLCPVERTPYWPDTTSCTFFNIKALSTTLRSLGAELVSCETRPPSDPGSIRARLRKPLRDAKWRLRGISPSPHTSLKVGRQLAVFQKRRSRPREHRGEYWDSLHEFHSHGES